jgi:Xaa-Pro dipeptidase
MDDKRIQTIQGELARNGLDGWLIYDFHASNDIAIRFLNLSGIITRRSFYFIPASGTPTAFVHAIEKKPFQNLPGQKIYYSSYRILEEKLRQTLEGKRRLAMEYSPSGRLPYIGKVDAGTVELIRSFGVEVVSSANLVAKFDACLNEEQIQTHYRAAEHLFAIKDATFSLVKKRVATGKKITEYDVVHFMLDAFEKAGMVADEPPICAVGPNGGNPHYVPTKDGAAEITNDSLVLIDLWAKIDLPHAVYADITWMAFAGSELPQQYADHFALLCRARDEAVAYIQDNWGKQRIYGYQVDDVCRGIIAKAGLDSYFTHRTGHSIAEETHGPGPNIDNLETEDRRELMPGHLFSIEPGLYFDDYGLRTEINVLITADGPKITQTPVQVAIVPLFG